MFKKRGISPLIGTVLIIGFLIGLAILIFGWGTKFSSELTEETAIEAEKEITFSTEVATDIKNAEVIADTISLLVENTGKIDIEKFKIRVHGIYGTDVINTDFGLETYGIKKFNVSFDSLKIGNVTEIEIFPMIIHEGKEAISKNIFDKIKIMDFLVSEESKILEIPEDTTPPGSISSLNVADKGVDYIYWTWTNPIDADFLGVIVYLDGINVMNTSNEEYNAAGLLGYTEYTITIHTVDTLGNINNVDVSDSTTTENNLDPGLAAYWSFNNGNAEDETASGNDGTLRGGISWQADGGYDGNGAYKFDGINDYIDAGRDVSLDLTNDFTIALWFYSESWNHADYPTFISKRDSFPGLNWQLFYYGKASEIQFWHGNSGSVKLFGDLNVNPSLNEWHHLAITRVGAINTLYLDGISQGTNGGGGVFNTEDKIRIGLLGANIAEGYFKGRLDDIRIYNRALDAGEIEVLAEA